MRKLEIGSGNRPLKGYEHLDINPNCPEVDYVAPMDKIPVKDSTFDEIVSVHVIEHQFWKETLNTLKEWIRVLKPGGMIKIACPNLKFILDAYLAATQGNHSQWMNDYNKMTKEEQQTLQVDGKPNPALWANFKIMSSGGEWDQHYACLDADLLNQLLIKAGASKTQVQHDGDSLVMKAWK
jgi:predicted SAM-dependent methyltransferase